MTMLTKTVKREVRKLLGPTGLLGKRGPAKDVRVLVRREVEARSVPSSALACSKACRFLEIGGTR